jgi:hypothetical protein
VRSPKDRIDPSDFSRKKFDTRTRPVLVHAVELKMRGRNWDAVKSYPQALNVHIVHRWNDAGKIDVVIGFENPAGGCGRERPATESRIPEDLRYAKRCPGLVARLLVCRDLQIS